MKYLLLLLVIGIGLWMVAKRLRGPAPPGEPREDRSKPSSTPTAMVECAHCGLHLPAADAVLDGRHVYCGEAHRRLGPRGPDGR
ncbi:PP0621 family protein [Aquabacterium humicola]|uniref:PP0621 family protein n=1 Tax=Aquabacterium humicola TaxID=3237377 RepID=UPI002543060B|nr:PP0621 family protein [Rubrivivax pictus]